jgi:hypothetical protein
VPGSGDDPDAAGTPAGTIAEHASQGGRSGSLGTGAGSVPRHNDRPAGCLATGRFSARV